MKYSTEKIVLLTMAVIVFITLVIGTAFAYFRTNTDSISSINLSANVRNISASLFTNSTVCSLNISPLNMLESNTSSNAVASSDCDLQITLSGEEGVSCSYEVFLDEKTDLENYVPYVPTSGLGEDYEFEFTGIITKSFSSNDGENATVETSYYVDENDTNIYAINNELQMNYLTDGLYHGNPSVSADGLITKGVIYINEDNVSVTHTYHFTQKWYNIDKPQTTHGGNHYEYVLSIKNVEC